jgi:hypothetical protein
MTAHTPSTTRPVTILTHVAQIEADARKGRQIEGPIALLWEPTAAEGQPRPALACTFNICRLPSCPCREVGVRVKVVDDRIFGLRNEGGDHTVILYRPGTADRTPKPWAELTLDLDGGDFVLHTAGNGASQGPHGSFKASTIPSVADVARFVSDLFRQNADAGLLDHLRDRWNVLKGKTDDWKGFDWSWFDPGDMLGWHEAFPKAADGMVAVGKRRLLPLDRYCVSPDCKCDEAKIEFVEVPEAGEAAQIIGVVTAKLSTGDSNEFEPAPGMTKLLRSAWKAYSEDANLDRLLPERRKRMVEVGQALLARRSKPVVPKPALVAPVSVPQPRAKVGPNEPCPCGSGVKFKRCCGGRG